MSLCRCSLITSRIGLAISACRAAVARFSLATWRLNERRCARSALIQSTCAGEASLDRNLPGNGRQPKFFKCSVSGVSRIAATSIADHGEPSAHAPSRVPCQPSCAIRIASGTRPIRKAFNMCRAKFGMERNSVGRCFQVVVQEKWPCLVWRHGYDKQWTGSIQSRSRQLPTVLPSGPMAPMRPVGSVPICAAQ